MRLADLHRTTIFRLTLLFSALLIGSVVLLFALIYWRTAGYLLVQVDESLIREVDELSATPADSIRGEIEQQLQTDRKHVWMIGLFGPDGTPIFGNLIAIPEGLPADGRVHVLRQPLHTGYEHDWHTARAIQRALPSGQRLIMARNADQLHEFRELMARAMEWGLGLSVGLALIGGLIMSIGSVRRIEAIHKTSAGIMAGDLSQRLPMRGTNDDFDKLSRIVNAMLEEIERLLGDVKSAGDNIAHDLRTPLTRLRTRLEGTLSRGGDVDAYRASIEDAITDLDSILATFRALLRIAEIEHGKRRSGFGEVDLGKIIGEVAELYGPLAEEKNIRLDVLQDGAALVHGDRDLLFEAIGNLADNAIKFTPPGGRVWLSVRKSGDGPVVEIDDTGPGIPFAAQETVFRRFARADKTRMTPGNGLGLSLVAAVVRLHGFRISIESEVKGCRVIVSCWPQPI